MRLLTNLPIEAAESVTTFAVDDGGRPHLVIFPPSASTGGRPIWRLLRSFSWGWEGSTLKVIPPFDFDGSSIPRPARAVISKDDLGTIGCLLHDALYRTGGNLFEEGVGEGWSDRGLPRTFTRKEADRIFIDAMEFDGVSWWRRKVAYAAVRIGGRGSWRA